MKFKEAFKLMKKGFKVKLPSWGGYWYWDKEKQTIMIQCRPQDSDQGDLLDIRETQRVEYTLRNILSNDWILATKENCPVLGGENTMSFNEAVKYLTRGFKLRRKDWDENILYLVFKNKTPKIKMSNGELVEWIPLTSKDFSTNDWVFIK